MKVFVCIGLMAVLLLSGFWANASSARSGSTFPCKPKKQNQFTAAKNWQPFFDNNNLPHRHFIHITRLEKKLRPYNVSAIQPNASLDIPKVYTGFPIEYISPSYLPLQRLLLFPNHYFW